MNHRNRTPNTSPASNVTNFVQRINRSAQKKILTSVLNILSLLLVACAMLFIITLHQIDVMSKEISSVEQTFGVLEKLKRENEIVIPEEPFTSLVRNLEEVIVLQGNEKSPLQHCSPTAQVKITFKGDTWTLQSLDHLGREKNQGGDEMYITYTDGSRNEGAPPTAVALIEDLDDGRYLLNFSTTPMNPIPSDLIGTGRLNIYFEFTCGIGSLPQPSKLLWKNSGSSFQNSVAFDVPEPAMKQFKPPQLPDLSHWPLVVFFGDSTMLQMVKDRKLMDQRQTEENIFLRPNLYFQVNIRTVYKTEMVKLILRKFQRMHRKQMLKYKNDVSIVLGSAAWDILVPDNIQGVEFRDHIEACKIVVEKLKGTYRGRAFYWKSPSSLHMHRVNCEEANYDFQDCLDSTRYLSNSRARALHYKQKALMKELDVPYLDLFDTYYLSSYYTAEGDGRHYTQELNEIIMSWFYPQQSNETVSGEEQSQKVYKAPS